MPHTSFFGKKKPEQQTAVQTLGQVNQPNPEVQQDVVKTKLKQETPLQSLAEGASAALQTMGLGIALPSKLFNIGGKTIRATGLAEEQISKILATGGADKLVGSLTKIGQTHTTGGNVITGAITQKTADLVTRMVQKAMLLSGIKPFKANRFLALMGTYVIGEWARVDTATTSLSIAYRDAIKTKNPELIEAAKKEYEELLNPSLLENIGRLLPSNVAVNFIRTMDSLKESKKIQDLIADDEKQKIENPELTDDAIIRDRQADQIRLNEESQARIIALREEASKRETQRIALQQQKNLIDKGFQERLQTREIEASRIRVAEAEDRLYRARLAEEERIQKENVERWIQYLELKAKLAEEGSNLPSQLKFGLL